jgi:hypothetical protein
METWLHLTLKAFSHGRPVTNPEPLNDYPSSHFFRMNMIKEAIFNELGRDGKVRPGDRVEQTHTNEIKTRKRNMTFFFIFFLYAVITESTLLFLVWGQFDQRRISGKMIKFACRSSEKK